MGKVSLPLPDQENWSRANILLIGDTGSGKSELVNKIFGIDIAKTGRGEPVTQHITYHLAPGETVGLYDTRGFEFLDGEEFIKAFVDGEVSALWDLPPEQRVHVVWLVLSANKRFGDLELRVIEKAMSLGLEVLVVATHIGRKNGEWSQASKAWWEVLESHKVADLVRRERIFPTNAVMEAKTPDIFGHEELIAATIAFAPAAIQASLTAGQTINLERKRALAEKIRDKYLAWVTPVASVTGVVPLLDSAVVWKALQKCTEEITTVYKVAPEVQSKIARSVVNYVTIGTTGSELGAELAKRGAAKLGGAAGEKVASEAAKQGAKEIAKKAAAKAVGPAIGAVIAGTTAFFIVNKTCSRLITALESQDIGHFTSADLFMELFQAIYRGNEEEQK